MMGKTVGFILVGMMVLITLVGLFYTPHPPNAMNIERRLEAPSAQFLLGTDNYGRDILSRIMVGGRPAFQAGMVAVALGLGLGTLWGAAAGYYRGWLEEVLMRMADGLYSLPSILTALLAVTLLGPGQKSILVAVALANIPIFARLTRSQFLSIRERSTSWPPGPWVQRRPHHLPPHPSQLPARPPGPGQRQLRRRHPG